MGACECKNIRMNVYLKYLAYKYIYAIVHA